MNFWKEYGVGPIFEAHALPVQEKKITYGPFVPNWSGTCFYRRGIQKVFWKSVYTVFEFFALQPKPECRLAKAVERGYFKLNNLVRTLNHCVTICQKAHRNLVQDKIPPSEASFRRARRFLTEFNDHFDVVASKKKFLSKVESIFRESMGKKVPKLELGEVGFNNAVNSSRRFQPLYNVSEALSDHPVPFSLFADLANGKELNQEEKVKLRDFARRLAGRKKGAMIPFIQTVSLFSDQNNPNDTREGALAAAFAKQLKKEGIKLHKIADPYHEKLKKDVSLRVLPDSKGCAKGVRFVEKREGVEIYRLGSKETLLIGNNGAHLPYLFHKQKKKGLPLIPVLNRDEKRGWYTLPRVRGDALKRYLEGDRAFKSRFEKGLYQLCKKWAALKKTPPLSVLENLLTSEKGDLFSLSLFKMEKPFSYLTLEAFLIKMADGSPTCFNRLMKGGGLKKRLLHKFFRDWVEHVLKHHPQNLEKEIERIAGWDRVLDGQAKKQAVLLGKKVLSLQKRVWNKVNKTIAAFEVSKEDIKDSILTNYCALGGGSALHFPEKLLKAVLLEAGLPS